MALDGGHFFDLLAEDVIFDYIITTPGYPRHVEGRKAVAVLYRPYGTMIVLADVRTSRSITTSRRASWCSSTPPKAESLRPGPRTPIGTSRYSRSPIVRSLTGATISTPWRSSTRSDGRHVDGRRKSAAGIGAPIANGRARRAVPSLSQSSETLSAELTKETSIVCLHPLLDEASLIVKPKDVD
jgi:hypothetical protein